MLRKIFSLLVLINIVSTRRNEISMLDDTECDMSWATDCFKQLQTFNGPLEDYCNLSNDTINVCLKSILEAQPCSEKYPRHSHYKMWLEPLNSVLSKFCGFSKERLRDLKASSKCLHGQFFTCLQEDVQEIGPSSIIELITSEITQDTCANLNFKAETCLQYNNALECRPLVDTVLELIKEFIESSTCRNQPEIFVPLNSGKSKTSSNDQDYSTELELHVLGKCFSPMREITKVETETSEPLHHFCLSANFVIQCLTDLRVYGGEITEQATTYQQLLELLTRIDQRFCDPKYDSPQLRSCWSDYYQCFQNSDVIIMLKDILVNKITPDTYAILIDEMESCVIGAKEECQDKFEDIINELRSKFALNVLSEKEQNFSRGSIYRNQALLLLLTVLVTKF